MIKYVVHSKGNKLVIFEVELEIVSAVEDNSIMFLYPGEYKARILKPDIFHQRIEKMINGKREFVLVPDVWHSFAFYDDLESAKQASVDLVRAEFNFNLRKYKTAYTEEDVVKALDTLEVIRLAS